MKCANCGSETPDGMRFCGMCGQPAAPRAVSPDEPRARYCTACGRAIAWDIAVCQHCGHDYRAPAKDPTKDWLVVGSILTMVASVLSIVLVTVILSTTGELPPESIAFVVLMYSCAFLGVMGGTLGLMRKAFPVAVLGAVCAIVGVGFFFAIPGLVLMAKSSKQFDGRA